MLAAKVIGVILEVAILAGIAFCILQAVRLIVFDPGMGLRYRRIFTLVLLVVGGMVVVFFISHLTMLYPAGVSDPGVPPLGFIEQGVMQVVVVFLVLLPLLVIVAIIGYQRRAMLWRKGKPEDRSGNWWFRLGTALAIGIANIRIIRRRELYPGLMHFCLAVGAILLFGGKFCRLFSVATGVTTPPQDFYLYASLVSEIGGLLLIVGGLLAVVRRYIIRPERLDNTEDDSLIFIWAALLIITGFIAKGYRIAVGGDLPADTMLWSPVGTWISHLFTTFPSYITNDILALHRAYIHAVPSIAFLACIWLYRSRLQHIVISFLNIFNRSLKTKGALKPIDFEEEEDFGVAQIEKFTWKQLMDLDACTRCGRCQDACPAAFSGKVLSPKKVIQDLKDDLYEVYPVPFSGSPREERRDMIIEVITEEALWDCTTCRACQEACPVYVEHVDKMIDMRRNLTMEQSQMPESAQEALKCLGTRWHPYRGTMQGRQDWADGMDIPVLAENADVEVLYWVGCTAALEERNVKVSQAFAKIMKAAGVNFGILGDEEMCCGDPARRMGDEYLYQTLCQQNIEVLKGYNVKKIVTACPHCFNNLKHEYPQFEGDFEVIHHSQFIRELVRSGRINPSRLDLGDIAFHDSCYLGRYNDIYDEPREVVKAVSGQDCVELPRSRANGFCCGGGGGHMWMEEEPETRISNKRVEEVIAADVPKVAMACPYCLVMFEDALKAKEVEENIKALDISEIVAAALEPEAPKITVAAEEKPAAEPAAEAEASPEGEKPGEETQPA